MSTLTPMSDVDVEQAIDRIREIHDEWNLHAERKQAGEPVPRFAGLAIDEEWRRLGARLAAEFGRRHGWIRARRRFWSPAILARRSTHASSMRQADTYGLQHDLFDHAYGYREPNRPYRAAGIAAHLYDSSADHPGDLAASAKSMGLILSWPDFPSWWYPGHTALALYVPSQSMIQRAA